MRVNFEGFFRYLIMLIASVQLLYAQDLPKGFSKEEEKSYKTYYKSDVKKQGARLETTSLPGFVPRTPGEWEEVDGVIITWRSYPEMHRDIVKALQKECIVYIVTTDSNSVKSDLTTNGISLNNVKFIISESNSVWVRDYGPNSVYANKVDSLVMVDWIYNRPRPKDDSVSLKVSTLLGISLFKTNQQPYNLVHTGGNFMADGFGTAFSSELVDDENTLAAGYGVNKTPAEVDSTLKYFMGITRNIKMTALPYDGIHHIDMHMKLLDEETLLVGEYPSGISDGPQIEANIKYVQDNYKSVYGTPYKIVRVPMPKDSRGRYPSNGGHYYTYTNSLIANKTVIVPIYNIAEDSTALRIYRNAMPGYSVVGINSTTSIRASGALHCITKEISAKSPLLISHQKLSDRVFSERGYTIGAYITHSSGIKNVELYYRINKNEPFSVKTMLGMDAKEGYYSASLPKASENSLFEYYIRAEANSGKVQLRPLPAPMGTWSFKIVGNVVTTSPSAVNTSAGINTLPGTNPINSVTGITEKNDDAELVNIFPNPANSIININASILKGSTISLYNIYGSELLQLYAESESTSISVADLPRGTIFLKIQSLNNSVYYKKIIIK